MNGLGEFRMRFAVVLAVIVAFLIASFSSVAMSSGMHEPPIDMSGCAGAYQRDSGEVRCGSAMGAVAGCFHCRMVSASAQAPAPEGLFAGSPSAVPAQRDFVFAVAPLEQRTTNALGAPFTSLPRFILFGNYRS